MKMIVEMPAVSKCAALSCAYNKGSGCHARAITVGDSSNPRCDTFFEGGAHAREVRRIAGVGACKVSVCEHNRDFECAARDISVGITKNQVKCLTFEART